MADDQGTRAPANATTLPADPATAATHASVAGESLPFDLPAAGYQLGTLIGKGGMGEVIAAQDQRIGREVAFKRMRSSHASGEALNRFLREARIQARLDHPAIVPVYELGKDAEGRPFFTMKRVTGKTLAAHLENTSARPQPLLRAFADVCLAIELAHSKGVVHRDLKPSNIMLGDYGEVYVLDWGVARVLTDRKRFPTSADRGDIDSLGETDGTMLGTPGYMAPEQMRGEASVGPAADVYALGAILFEILTGAPLHPRGHASVSSTLTMEGASPAQRHPDRAIAPELDAACAETLAADPAKRPSARELGDRVQRYLDGDRDAERRHVLAQERMAAAREAIASGDTNRRVEALRAAGRALALEPGSTEAADLVSSLIVEPPTVLPEDLRKTLADTETAAARERGRRAAAGYISLLSLSVFLVWFDIVNWGPLVAIYVAIGFFIAISWTTWKTGRTFLWPVLLGSVVMAVVFSRIAGPFVLMPVLMCGAIIAVCNIPWVNDRPWALYVWTALLALVPSLLEHAGVIAATTVVKDGSYVLRSAIVGAGGRVDVLALVLVNLALMLAVARFAHALARDRRTAYRQLTIQAWHLDHLLPKGGVFST